MSIKDMGSYLKALFSRYEVPKPIEELNEINRLIFKGNFDEALNSIKNIEFSKYGENEEYYYLYSNIYKAQVYNELGKPDDATKLLDDVESKSLDPDYRDLLILSKLELSNIYIRKGEMDKAIKNLEEIERDLARNKYYLKDKYYQIQAIYYYSKAKMNRAKGELNDAISNLEKSILLKKIYRNEFETASPLNDLGIIYAIKGESKNAIKNLNKSLDIYKSLGNETTVLKIYNNLGTIQMNSADFDGAYQNLMLALPISEKLANNYFITSIKMNLGTLSRYKGEIKDALNRFNECLEIFDKEGNKPGYSYALNQIGSLKTATGELDEAYDYFNRSLDIEKTLGRKSETADNYMSIGNIFQSKGEYEKALEYYKNSYELFKEAGQSSQIMVTLSNLIETYIMVNDRDNAKTYLDEMKVELDKNPSKVNDTFYRMVTANYLASSDRVIPKADAQRIYMQIANEEMITQELTIEGLLGLTRLLLAELKIVKSEEVLNELREVMDRLYLLTDTSKGASADLYRPRVHTLILRSQLAIIDLDIEFAQKLLQEGFDLAESKGLTRLKELVKSEQDKLKDDLLTYKKMVEKNASIYERLQQSQIENYLARAQSILNR